MSGTTLEALSYQASVRALDLQERAVDQLRSRTGTLLAATSLTASFLGAQVIQQTHRLGTLGVLALVSLAVSIAACTYILVPKSGFVFGLNAPGTYEALFKFATDVDEVQRRLTYWLESYWADNQTIIDALGRYYVTAALALTLQLGLWCVALTTNIP